MDHVVNYHMKVNREAFILHHDSGKTLNDVYDVQESKLGEGTYGTVCQAVNRSTRKVRAIKTVSKAQLKNVKRFRQEIAIMKQLDHPNIIKLFETFEDAKNIYLVLELCSGGELFDRIIDEGSLSEKMSASIMKQIIGAIYYLHSHKIVHRDLKPENFLFQSKAPDSPVKIIDFGLAAKFEVGDVLKTKAGTPYYVSPDVLSGGYNEKCDIWSCGVINYILLCGYPPFYGDTDSEILKRVKSGKFKFPSEEWDVVSLEAKDLISRCLVVNPDLRADAEEALNHDWIQRNAEHAIGDEVVHKSVVKYLNNFRAQNKFKKLALTVVAHQLPEQSIENLRSTFKAIDTNGDGTLTVAEIKDGMMKHDVKIPMDLDDLIGAVDSDGSGSIDYTEFIAATMDRKLYIEESVCWSAFRVFDLDGDGTITKAELRQVLENDQVKDTVTNDMGLDLEELVREADVNGDGQIDFDEFMAMMRRR